MRAPVPFVLFIGPLLFVIILIIPFFGVEFQQKAFTTAAGCNPYAGISPAFV